MKRRLISAFLLCLILLSSAACGKNEVNITDTTTAATETVPPETSAPVEDLVVIEADGKTAFTVVRADEADGMTVNIAIALHTSLKNTYKSKVALASDITNKKEADGSVVNDKYEILVGKTNRRESIEAVAELADSGKDYMICVKGKKLIILGATPYATKYAVNLFMNEYIKRTGEGLTLPGDLLLTGEGVTRSVSLTEGADLRIMTFNLRGNGENPNARFSNIQETILTYLPDVIGFQEANGQYNGVLNKLEDYAIVETEMKTNCTPILYLKDKYTQVDGGCEFLDSRYTGTNTKSIEWVVLKSHESGKLFCVINLHGAVLTNDYDGYAGMSSAEMNAIVSEWRVDNVRQMLELRDRVEAKHGDLPVMFTGDFNFKHGSAAYQATLNAGLTEAEFSAKTRMTGYNTWHSVGVAPTAGKSIDHIFYHPDDVTALRHHIAMADGFEIKASDHCAVWADVKLMK